MEEQAIEWTKRQEKEEMEEGTKRRSGQSDGQQRGYCWQQGREAGVGRSLH